MEESQTSGFVSSNLLQGKKLVNFDVSNSSKVPL